MFSFLILLLVIPANDSLLSTFWNTLRNAKPNVNKILPLPLASFLPENMSGLYIRESYKTMFQIMETKIESGIHRFAITGTPGIGKSMFLFYLMWLLSKMESVNAVILRRSKDGGEIFVFKKDCCFSTFQYSDVVKCLHDKSTWYLTDALSPPPAEVSAVTIVVASPSKHLYNAFLKYAPAIRLNYLPIWTLEELYQCATDLFPGTGKCSIQERYDLIGGVPRFVLESPQNLEGLIATGVGKLVIEKCNQIADGSLQREDEVSHLVIHFGVEQDLETYSLQFASLYVAEKAYDRFNVHSRQNLVQFLADSENQSALASLRGQLFESHAHRQLYSGGTFDVRPLKSDSSAKTDLTLSKLDVKRFKNIAECSESEKYYIPISKRFSCIDSVIRNIGFFQMTVSERHPINMNEMEKLLTGDFPFSPDIFFAVPNDIYPKFRAQEFITREGRSAKKLKASIRNLNQYALKIDIPQ